MTVWIFFRYAAAITSGFRGGMMVGDVLIRFLNERGWFTVRDEDTILDELLGIAVAVLGVGFQFHFGFSLPSPFNLIMFPLDLLETWLWFNVMSE